MPLIASVVVPTYNRCDRLPRVLAALADQTVARESYEIIVVSDGSTDGTDDYLMGPGAPHDVIAITQPNGGPGSARNAGTERASGPLVIFVDDDVIAAPDLVEQHLRSHEGDVDDGDSVVMGPMLLPADYPASAWITWEQEKIEAQYDAMVRGDWAPTFRQFYTGNASLARSLLDEAGGFDPRYRRAEDVELSYRLHATGCRFSFNPDAIGWHHAERPYRSWLGNASDYGRNDVIFARDLGRTELLEIVRDEFRFRHGVIRSAVRLATARPRLGGLMQGAIDVTARSIARLPLERPTSAALSLAYNLAYYRAVAAELGGADVFRRAVLAPRSDVDSLPVPES